MDKLSEKIQSLNPVKHAFRICSLYFLISALWILVTDLVNTSFQNYNYGDFIINSGKGLVFITITSILFYFILKKYFLSLHNTGKLVKISEEKYRTLADNINIGIIRHNIDGSYNYLNSTGKNIISQSLIDENADIIGKKPEDIFSDQNTIKQVYEIHNLAVNSKSSIKRKFKIGKQHLSVEVFPEFDTSGKMISVLKLYTDETELTERLIKHTESELFNKHLLNFSNVLVYIFDVENHNNVFVNEAIYTLTGFTKDDLRVLGDSFFNQLIHPDDISGFAKHVEDVVMKLPDGEFSEFEYRLKCRNGNYKWLKGNNSVYKRNKKGEPVEILGSSVDITELKKVQEEITIKTEYLKAVIDASPMSIFDVNSEGKVQSIWNKASEKIFGWNAEETLGKILPTIPDAKMGEYLENININVRGDKIAGKELERRRKDGKDLSVRLYTQPITDDDGKLITILAFNEDITFQKKYEKGLLENEEYLKNLYKAGLMANGTYDTDELYKKSFDFIEKIVDVTGIIVTFVTGDRKFIKCEAMRVNGKDVDTDNIPLMMLRPDGKGPQTRAIKTGESIIIKDLEESAVNSKNNFYIDSNGNVCTKDETNESVSRASIMIPLKDKDKVIGVLQVQSYNTDFYTEEDMHKLEPFSFILASAMQRTKLYQNVQNELREKEAAFEQIRKFAKGIEHSPNSIIITNANYEIEFINPYFTELTGYTLEEVQGKNPNILQSGQTKKELYEEMWRTLEKGDTWHGEFLNLKKSGELFWESASIGPIFDSIGKITHYIAIKQDITEKKKKDKELKDSLEEKVIMLKEIHHRVKNNLQVISSLLNMQIEQYNNPAVVEALNSSRNRVKTMALVHENLYKSSNIGKTSIKEYLHMLAVNIFSSFGITFDRVNFNSETNAFEFGLDTIIPLGLILNEAISNSLKHAFPGNRYGEISVNLREMKDTEDYAQFELCIKDNGIGLPAEFDPDKTNSLGVTLLTSLAMQLDGNAVFKNDKGTEIIIIFKELKYKK